LSEALRIDEEVKLLEQHIEILEQEIKIDLKTEPLAKNLLLNKKKDFFVLI
jgi:virulence-associated protein VagC